MIPFDTFSISELQKERNEREKERFRKREEEKQRKWQAAREERERQKEAASGPINAGNSLANDDSNSSKVKQESDKSKIYNKIEHGHSSSEQRHANTKDHDNYSAGSHPGGGSRSKRYSDRRKGDSSSTKNKPFNSGDPEDASNTVMDEMSKDLSSMLHVSDPSSSHERDTMHKDKGGNEKPRQFWSHFSKN